MSHRYWNADSDLDWQYGNAPPEEAPQEEQHEPIDEAVDATQRMIAEVDAAIPGHDGAAMLLRQRVRKICLAYGDARGAIATRNANAIWSRTW